MTCLALKKDIVMSMRKFTVNDLDEDFHQMNREELLEDIAARIQSQREMLIEGWHEKDALKADCLELCETLKFTTGMLETLTEKVQGYEVVFIQANQKIQMWKITSYVLAILILILCFYIWNFKYV